MGGGGGLSRLLVGLTGHDGGVDLKTSRGWHGRRDRWVSVEREGWVVMGVVASRWFSDGWADGLVTRLAVQSRGDFFITVEMINSDPLA